MRYTRYEYKKHGKIKFLCTIAVIAAVSILTGLCFSKFMFKGNVGITHSNQSVTSNDNENFIALQFGYYSNKDNADAAINTIPSKYSSYIVEDEGKYRVVIGLYSQEDGINELGELTSQGINVVKVNFNIYKDNLEQQKIAEVIGGFLKISNKLEDIEVKGIKTSDYKAWCSGIVNEDSSSNFQELKLVGEYINNLPEEIDKTNVKVHLKYFYEVLEKYKD